MENTDKTSRSIFVGNIPYEATEEKLMSLFNQAGPVIGFRLVYDRESGKPKGYGFCEYNSTAIAASALRNLNNIEYNGRPLRIGPAAGEQNSAEVAMTNNSSMKPPQESPYGERVDPKQAGATISQAVASLPPEQLYELMVQMKQCIQNNPNEARQLLLQNPQLTYALLQAQITMRIIEPKVAIAMMTRSNEQIPVTSMEQQQPPHPMTINQGPSMPPQQQPPQQMFMPSNYPPNVEQGHHPVPMHVPMQPQMQPPMSMPSQMPMPSQMQQPMPMPSPMQQPMPMPNQMQPPLMPMPNQMPHNFNAFSGMLQPNFNQSQMFNQQSTSIEMQPKEVKLENTQPPPPQSKEALDMMHYFDSHGEKSKAALIMQVLSLTDEQVAKLPDDQRRSIEVLKNQLKKT